MANGHPGFPKEGLAFLAGLAKNNDRAWFQARKDVHDEHVRGAMAALVEALDAELSGFAPECVTPPAKAIPRQHRDVRFGADKSPYKTHVAAILPWGGRKKESASGFYVGISPKGAELVAGAHVPDPPSLSRLRTDAAAHAAAWRRVLAEPALRRHWGGLDGERLQRVPRGFDADHPAEDLLRLKRWSLRTELPPEIVTSPRLLPEIVARFRSATPFVRRVAGVLSPR